LYSFVNNLVAEPMTLGSPVNSPGHISPVMPHGSQFLPGYLMGDVTPNVSTDFRCFALEF